MPQLPEKRSPVQKAPPGVPPRARKSQPKSLQYRPKSAQHLPEEPMSPKSTQCHPKKVTQCPGIFADCYRLSPPTPRGWVVVAGCKDLPIQTPNDSHKGLSFIVGAENGARTRDLNLGKVALYQLSYFRNITPYLAVGITKVRSFFKFANYF